MLILLQSMVAGVTGSHSLNVLTHVAEVHRHVKGNAIIQVRRLEECPVQEIKTKLNRVTRMFVEVFLNMFLKFTIPKYKKTKKEDPHQICFCMVERI